MLTDYNQDNVTLLQELNSIIKVPAYVNWNLVGTKKIPVQKTNKLSQLLTSDEALSKSPRIGLVINDQHSIVALDLDGVSLTDPLVRDLIAKYPTYIERTPSNKDNHYRILYRVNYKHKLTSTKFVLNTDDGVGHIDVFVKSENYITLTGQPIIDKPIAVLPLENSEITLLSRFYQEALTPALDKIPSVPDTLDADRVLRQVSAQVWLAAVPCNENSFAVKKFCHAHNIGYYDYWLMGLMALHAVLGPINGLPIAAKWSKSDPNKWSPEAFESTWKSLNYNKNDRITAGTYLHMYKQMAFEWPVLTDKGKASILNYSNWLYLLDYLQLSFTIDPITKSLILNGPDFILYPDIFQEPLDRYKQFSMTIEAYAHRLSVFVSKFRVQIHPRDIKTHLANVIANAEAKTEQVQTKSLFQVWLEAQATYNPNTEPDYISRLWGDAIQSDDTQKPDREHRIQIGRLWMYSLLRSMLPDWMNNGAEFMIILLGPSRTGKTTFAANILPSLFRHLYTEVTAMTLSSRRTASSIKDYYQQISSALVVNVDEGGFFFGYSQEFSDFAKSEVTSNILDVRMPYGRTVTKMRRLNSLLMTTNDPQLALPREGTRRYMIVNVNSIDHTIYNAIPRDRLFAQVLYELRQFKTTGAPPWAPPQELLDYFHTYIDAHRKTSNLEELLLSIYDFSTEGYTAKLEAVSKFEGSVNQAWTNMWVTAPQIRQLAFEKGYHCTLKETHATLQRLCATRNPLLPFQFCRTVIETGTMERNRQVLYFLPASFPGFS